MDRLQWERGKKLPPGARLVIKESQWRNPFRVSVYGQDGAVVVFRRHVESMTPLARMIWLRPLQDDKSITALACTCKPDEPCHVDVLIEYLSR